MCVKRCPTFAKASERAAERGLIEDESVIFPSDANWHVSSAATTRDAARLPRAQPGAASLPSGFTRLECLFMRTKAITMVFYHGGADRDVYGRPSRHQILQTELSRT